MLYKSILLRCKTKPRRQVRQIISLSLPVCNKGDNVCLISVRSYCFQFVIVFLFFSCCFIVQHLVIEPFEKALCK